MTIKIAINGFGRIGRLVARALFESGRDDIELVAINDLAPLETSRYLLRYDSAHGRFPLPVEADGGDLVIAGRRVKVFRERGPEDLPWGDLGVDIALECTGLFTKREGAEKHLAAGAGKVLISAPAAGEDITVVYGVNHADLRAGHRIVSNASCTTNCLAPVAHVLHEAVGITSGFMTTIHAYTGDQRVVDTTHADLHRARGAAVNMIPTSTGAAKAVGKVLPALDGLLDGVAIRVPTHNVSLVDFTFVAGRATDADEVNAALSKAAEAGPLAGVLGVYDEPLVSTDFNHNPLSSIASLDGTKVTGGTLVRVMSWYDNEWGFSNRMLDTAAAMAKAA